VGRYDAEQDGTEADRLLAGYEALLGQVAADRKITPEILHRAVKWAFPRVRFVHSVNPPPCRDEMTFAG